MILLFLSLLSASAFLYCGSSANPSTQEELVQEILGPYHSTLLAGEVEEFQELVWKDLQDEEVCYGFEKLWNRVSSRFVKHYENHQALYQQKVSWAQSAQDILGVINDAIDSDAGLPFPLCQDECRKNQYVCMLRKSKILDKVTAAINIESLGTSGCLLGGEWDALQNFLKSFSDSLQSAQRLCARFAERAIMDPESLQSLKELGVILPDIYDYAGDYIDTKGQWTWTVRESASGLFDMSQWFVSVMHGKCLHGLPILQEGVSEVSYHDQRANGFYNFLLHDISHNNKFLKFAFMWQKTFTEETYVCQYLLEEMWKRVKCFASQSNPTKVLETVVIFFYWMHESCRLHLQESGAKWLESVGCENVNIYDEGYVGLISKIAGHPLDLKGAEEQLSQWYRDHIVPVLGEIVVKNGYRYYGPIAGREVHRVWGFKGDDISLDMSPSLLLCIVSELPYQYGDVRIKLRKLWQSMLPQEGNCVLWPYPYIQNDLTSPVIFIPSYESLKSISFGHIYHMMRN